MTRPVFREKECPPPSLPLTSHLATSPPLRTGPSAGAGPAPQKPIEGRDLGLRKRSVHFDNNNYANSDKEMSFRSRLHFPTKELNFEGEGGELLNA